MNLAESRVAPWAGLLAGMVGEAAHHQVLSDVLRFDCRLGTGGTGLVAAALVLALFAAGAWLSWRSMAVEPPVQSPQTRRFVARLSLMAVALFTVAVAWQTLAMWLVPPCP